MESIIKTPFKSYVIVANSGSSSDTYINKLLSLKSAFEGLSYSQKIKSFVLQPSGSGFFIYRIQHFTSDQITFGLIDWRDTNRTSGTYVIVDLVTGNRKIYVIKDDGTIAVLDGTNNSTSANIQLGYWL